MIAADTVRRVRAHAGLDADPLDPTTVSGAVAAGDGVDAAVTSLLAELQAVNAELNGGTDRSLPADLAYGVAECARMLRGGRHDQAAWALDTAWLAVLAGDIDDVAAHVAEERGAR